MQGISITPAAGLAMFSRDLPLFQIYSYWNRLSRETHEPLPEPITDFREALALLYSHMGDRTGRWINKRGRLPDGTEGPTLCIGIFNGGYTKDLLTKTYEFPLAPEVLAALMRKGVVSGTKHMGYTDMNELRLNDDAVDLILDESERFSKEQQAAALQSS